MENLLSQSRLASEIVENILRDDYFQDGTLSYSIIQNLESLHWSGKRFAYHAVQADWWIPFK